MASGQYTKTEEQKQKISQSLTGRTLTVETREKMSKSKMGLTPWNKGKVMGARYSNEQSHPSWKGNKVGKRALHTWVDKWKGQPETCEGCGSTGLRGKKINWANVDHQYRRVLDDYIRLCVKCHGAYDTSKGFRKRKGVYISLEELDKLQK